MNSMPSFPHSGFEERLRFEMLLTEVSARFVSATSESIDAEIVSAQKQIVQELGTIRIVDADYVLTRFGNNFTGGNNSQSNFRVQFRFQKKVGPDQWRYRSSARRTKEGHPLLPSSWGRGNL